MDLVASYLQQQKQQQQQRQQSLFPLRSGRCENNDADSIVSAAMSSMAIGAARALRKSRARAEQNVEGARAVTAFALTPTNPSPSSSAASAGFAALIPGNSPAEIVFTSGISSFLSLYNAAIVGRLLLSWWPQAPQAIVSPLATLTDPYLGLFRGIIPPLGGTIDLSPILAFVTLDLLTSSAAALPCEMPATATTEGEGGAKKGGAKKAGLAPRRVPPRAGGRWGVPSLVAAAKRRRSSQQQQ